MVAVYVVNAPIQGVMLPDIESVALITGFTVIAIELLVAEDDEKHPPTGIVITQEITSLFANPVVL